MLQYEVDIPANAGDGAPLLVLLHGRGSDRFDLLGLRRGLPPEAVIVTPQAPFPGAPWGYGPGWAWYRFLGEDRPEPESFEQSQVQLEEFLVEIAGKLPVEVKLLAVGGFSQGGTMSVGYALRHPGELPCVLNFSGFLPAHPTVHATVETVKGTRFFWGHGTEDPAIPFSMARAGREKLNSAGADLTTSDFRIGHWIDPQELAAATEWLQVSNSATTAD